MTLLCLILEQNRKTELKVFNYIIKAQMMKTLTIFTFTAFFFVKKDTIQEILLTT